MVTAPGINGPGAIPPSFNAGVGTARIDARVGHTTTSAARVRQAAIHTGVEPPRITGGEEHVPVGGEHRWRGGHWRRGQVRRPLRPPHARVAAIALLVVT